MGAKGSFTTERVPPIVRSFEVCVSALDLRFALDDATVDLFLALEDLLVRPEPVGAAAEAVEAASRRGEAVAGWVKAEAGGIEDVEGRIEAEALRVESAVLIVGAIDGASAGMEADAAAWMATGVELAKLAQVPKFTAALVALKELTFTTGRS